MKKGEIQEIETAGDAVVTGSEKLPEGRYILTLGKDEYVVNVRETMQGKRPSMREVLVAHFESGPPRMPIPVRQLQEWGCSFAPNV